MRFMFTLNNGVEVPGMCFGGGIIHTIRHDNETIIDYIKYRIKTRINNPKQYELDQRFTRTIRTAMNHGICMFDTSKAYKDAECELGSVLKAYNRNSFFIVTKLCNSDQYSGNIRSAFESSLKSLGLEQIDLYLMHWPVEGVWIDNWKEIEKIYEEGLCKAIGVCNCNIHHLEELKMSANVIPMVNEIECHPLFTQNELRRYCKENRIQVMAYTSTARMDDRLKKTVLTPIAKKYQKSISQIILKWHQQIGNIPIFHSSNPEHIIENINIDDFILTDDEVESITAININSRLRYDPDNCDFKLL